MYTLLILYNDRNIHNNAMHAAIYRWRLVYRFERLQFEVDQRPREQRELAADMRL